MYSPKGHFNTPINTLQFLYFYIYNYPKITQYSKYSKDKPPSRTVVTIRSCQYRKRCFLQQLTFCAEQ